ncbi:hypothetical protein Fleli_3945 [Bernardetia litoralis DSM 6794]|uniref:DUF2520 domain-containing protein n=1 Tax=Bernardetia litoralis (strain ATCC 23117 / DSM 6794 / NBRC 15988 / NCIMB 1366 / Fx l1 / Sio-4) TaxID=880071 RepID=I4AQL2_BERLS|nr:Rossmann-like and DUF2520 domain-containing protein [Bernardetia litoralis]AFM06247.1 hypothetical protein Fleli_3945 [Bernardetia litoralis DSM 6794]
MKTIFIGAGNVAWHLAMLFFKNKNVQITHIWSRNKENAELLKDKLDKNIEIYHSLDSLDFSKTDADLAILSIADGAFESVLSKLILPKNCILAHTSGAQPMEILKLANYNSIKNIGVFYPLQTFSKAKEVDFSSIPFCIEANNKEIEEKLTSLANQFSQKVFQVSSKDRSILHVAAVFVCNFSNYLWTISETILKEKNLPFDMMKPLLEETLQKALEINPSNAQTGPAIRNDEKVIEKHLNMIEEMNLNSNFSRIYKLMTESIQQK